MNARSTSAAGKAKLPIHLPITHQQLGAGTGRGFVVDAVGRKLTGPMPAGFAQYRAAKFNAEVEAGKSSRFMATKPAAPVATEAIAAPAAGFGPLGTIHTSTNPYMVTADLPLGTSAVTFDAGWLDLIDRLAAAIDRHQVVMQQDADLREEHTMQLQKGYRVGKSDQDDGPVIALVFDPYTYSAHLLRRDAGRIRDAVRFALSGGVQA
ncbi:hypothetical protein GCM10007242_44390 [Pigmentiphaga litoralis]|uniref:hypothetical protein n=1 Tax=Pigmentiphaga litoralis TaxID=516702 RepID=UPI00167463AE|nr:hypothetical protein [Pigmentiphaga litoralis]GGX32587.1 hypothetical protein GCM10007242_44390 [Pigmentiphaga litoralis]